MPQSEKNTPAQTPAMTVAQAEHVMQERLTRRAALRKLGFGAGIAALALLSTDDLARMVGKRLQQIAGDNQIAETVAKELKRAGLASAATATSGPCDPYKIGQNCNVNYAPYQNPSACAAAACQRCYGGMGGGTMTQIYNFDQCYQDAAPVANTPQAGN